MKIEILPFTSEMIPAAGSLLAKRHARSRAKLPLLPARFEDPQTAARAVEALWNRKLSRGFAAFRDGQLIAYLLGERVIQPWGRVGYVYLPGYALAEAESPRILQDLYSLLGAEWVKKGFFIHDVYISAADETIIQAFFELGFGKERVDALLDVSVLQIPEYRDPVGVEIRRAGRGDNNHLGNLSNVIANTLSSAPYWHPRIPEEDDERREGWSALAEDREWTIWLALENDQALGMVGLLPDVEEDTKMLTPAGAVYFSLGVTQPAARGRGISTALTWRGLQWARNEGFKTCYTNWVSPNLLAARFWPRFGFSNAAYRLAKRIDPIIAWAREP